MELDPVFLSRLQFGLYRVLRAGPADEPESASRLPPGRPIAVALQGRQE